MLLYRVYTCASPYAIVDPLPPAPGGGCQVRPGARARLLLQGMSSDDGEDPDDDEDESLGTFLGMRSYIKSLFESRWLVRQLVIEVAMVRDIDPEGACGARVVPGACACAP